ncbi:MAG TPA: helix-turn-helix transcriptional regulator [Actinocrinis sp.]|nr:helix-turn-helix transcriptional regulator [Actinocrinis sp.]
MANLHLTPKHVAQLGAYIREQRESAQFSLRQLAQVAGVSNPYLSQIERGLRKPSAEVLQQLAKALQISAETLYVRAGLLDESTDSAPAGQAVVTAIMEDPELSLRQKQILREIYESFRAERGATNGSAKTADNLAEPGV